MTLKEKSKTYTFWISLVSALIVLAKTIAEHFGYNFNQNLLLGVAAGVASILVLVGVLTGPSKKATLKSLEEKSKEIYDDQTHTIEQIKEDIMEQNLSLEEQLEYLKRNIAEKTNKTVENNQKNDEITQNVTDETANIAAECQNSITISADESEYIEEQKVVEEASVEPIEIAEPTEIETGEEKIGSDEIVKADEEKEFSNLCKTFNVDDYSLDELKTILVKILTNIL